MNLKNIMILWNPNLNGSPTEINIVPVGCDDRSYLFSMGGNYAHVQQMTQTEKTRYLFIEAMKLIIRDNMDPRTVHNIFCEIKEYRDGLSHDTPVPEHLKEKFRNEVGNKF